MRAMRPILRVVAALPLAGGGDPDGHFKFPHLWPLKLSQAGRADYELSAGLSAMREAASFKR